MSEAIFSPIHLATARKCRRSARSFPPGARTASICSGRKTRRSGIRPRRFSFRWLDGPAMRKSNCAAKTYPAGVFTASPGRSAFEVAEQGADFLRLLLSDDDETRALYPFSFRLEVEFRLASNRLENALIVTNPGDETPSLRLRAASRVSMAARRFGRRTRNRLRERRRRGGSDHRPRRPDFAPQKARSDRRPKAAAVACASGE